MIKVKALQEFTYRDFDKIKNLERHNKDKNQHGRLYAGDTFECTKDMATYLTGGCGYVLVKILEVIPEEIQDGTLEHPYTTIMPEPIKEESKVEEIASKPKTTRKSTPKKTKKK